MDDTEKKLFAMLDADMPGERSNALELLHAHQKKIGHFCRDIVQEIEIAIPLRDYEDAQNQLAAAMQANAGLARQYQAARVQLGAYKTILSIRRYWRHATACVTLPVIALVGFEYFTAAPPALRAARDAGFQAMAHATAWADTSADSPPVVREVAGAPWWIIVRRDQNTAHEESDGRPVTVQCVRVYADEATPDAGAYLKPRPYAFWGWGWLTWPQLGADCRTENARASGLTTGLRARK